MSISVVEIGADKESSALPYHPASFWPITGAPAHGGDLTCRSVAAAR
jgi:hypothetical protein